MLFCKASKKNAESLKAILATYESVSGQLINKQKPSIFFSKRTDQAIRDQMKAILGVDKERRMGKYLGFPEEFGRKKKDIFASVVCKVQQRARSWSSKFLSSAEKNDNDKEHPSCYAIPHYVALQAHTKPMPKHPIGYDTFLVGC